MSATPPVTSVKCYGILYFVGQKVKAWDGKAFKECEISELVPQNPLAKRYLATVKFSDGTTSRGHFLHTLQLI